MTIEMIEAMSLDQRKSLLANASRFDTENAKDIVAMLTEGDLMTRSRPLPVVPQAPAVPKKMRPRAV